ncbi:hypothetical protein JZ751_018659 [Albula glossodonta]|uniref:SAM domain-containing protein n=1 Tax=Albula glossodonta TaxID=121402 RepID=A0A8T2MWM0_9TELE|nr:hypothetical protein JZ751_018659 [Albula glossodonta]
MNNRSIAWWLRQIGLPQYTKTLERQYYGLEGLLYVTEGDLREAGVEDAEHRQTILTQLKRQQQKLNPTSGVEVEVGVATPTRRVTRKYSLGSSMDLLKPSRRLSGHTADLFRQSILPKLRRRDKVALSSSCSQLSPLQEALSPEMMRPPQPHASDHREHHSNAHGIGSNLGGLRWTSTVTQRVRCDAQEQWLPPWEQVRTCEARRQGQREQQWCRGSRTVHGHVFGGKRGMDSLKKELEEELKLSTEDLRSHAWYHGQLHREWRNEPMHFKIIRVVLRPKKGYSRELFQFEQDQFDNIPALVRFHVGGRRPISEVSGAIIFHPMNRTVPLRVISERQAARAAGGGDTCWSGEEQRSRSERSAPQSSQVEDTSPAPISPVFRTGSEPMLSPRTPRHTRPSHPGGGATLRGSDGQLHSRAPPKPLRISAMFPGPVPPPLPPRGQEEEEDPACFYDELVPRVPTSHSRGHVDRLRAEEKWQSRARLTETSFGFLEPGGAPRLLVTGPGTTEEAGPEEVEGAEPHFVRPQVETVSCFQLDQFHSLLLPENNRPLEPSVLLALKELFTRSDAKTTALHMLSVDCQVARITGVTEEQKRLMGVPSGLELITLPHGHQLRQDLLERCDIIILRVDILGCTGTVGQRATVLHKVIQLAQELCHTARDLYAFSAVMKALELPQVARLEMTWRALRRNHTDSAVAFEKKLKPVLKSLNEGDDGVVRGPVSVPHILPILRVMEGEELGEHTDHGCQLLLNILQSARNAALKVPQYQAYAHSLLTGGWEPIPELLEAFRTEFALRLFWGQSGADAEQQERYEKFDMVLSVLSEKLESGDIPLDNDL